MRKKEIGILMLIVAACAIVFLCSRLSKQVGGEVRVMVDGALYASYGLKEEKVVEIATKYGHNTLQIVSGSATMTAADCPDQYCVRQGSIDRAGQKIVCLPHRVVVEVDNKEKPSIDATVN